MLQQPMMEKLHALKLQGLLEALERQEQDETARELSFLDRLALLIDQQWNWRQNQALARRVRASRLKGAACVENIDYRAERGLSKSVIRALGPGLCLGEKPRTHFRARSYGRGQKLCRFGTGTESLPGRLLGLLLANCGAVPGSEPGTSGRQSAATSEAAQPHRCSG